MGSIEFDSIMRVQPSGGPRRRAATRVPTLPATPRCDGIPAVRPDPHPSSVRRRAPAGAWPTAAAPACVPRTRWRPSSTAPRAAPTASSSTSASRATARWSSSTTTRSTARPTRRGRSPASPRDELARVDAAAKFKAGGGRAVQGTGHRQSRGCATCSRVSRGLPCVVELKGDDPAVAHAAVDVARECGALDARLLRRIHRRGRARGAGRDPARRSPARATEEIRWALYRAWVGLAPKRPALPRVPGARALRSDAGGHAAVRARDAARRPLRPRLDGERAAGHDPAARLGRQRRHHRRARRRGAGGEGVEEEQAAGLRLAAGGLASASPGAA